MTEPAKSVCPHGFEIGKNRLTPGAYAAPIGTCRCCGTRFVYIGFGSYSSQEQHSVSPDATLCRECGGKPRIFHRKRGEVLVDEPGTAVDQ